MNPKEYKISKKNIYFYTFKSTGTSRVYKGHIYTLKTDFPKLLNPTFREKGKHKKKMERHCSLEPEIFSNGCLWMRERDDEKAKEIYFEYVKSTVEKHKKTIENLTRYYTDLTVKGFEDWTKEN